MNLIRKLKISEITLVDFTESEKIIIDLFNDSLKDLVIFIDDSKPWQINYMKPDGIFIIQHDNTNDRLWVRNDGFWNVLESDFGLTYTDIQILVKYMVERALKLKVSRQKTVGSLGGSIVERAFKQKINDSNFKNNIKL